MDENSQIEDKEEYGGGDIDEEMLDENENNIQNKNEKEKNEEDINIRKPGEKQKRRSKNECNDRYYTCGCGKKYLSYPALYTHIKTKHDGKTPEGTNINQVQNGKGRGRPRKNFLTNEETIIKKKRENNRRYNENQSNELKDFLNYRNCSTDIFKKGENKFKMIYYFFGLLNIKESEKIKNREMNNNMINDKKNNNNLDEYNIRDLFTEEMINNSSSYKALYTCYNDLVKKGNLDIDKIEKKELITCDQAFIYYLYYISKIVSQDFCLINLIIIKHFRDLVNKLGWNLLSRFKTLDDEDTSIEYSINKEPLKIPLLTNDFCNNYIKKVMNDFDVYFAFIIISHFNFWLYANDLTFIKLNLPNVLNEEEKKMKEKNDFKVPNNINGEENNNNIKNKKENINF